MARVLVGPLGLVLVAACTSSAGGDGRTSRRIQGGVVAPTVPGEPPRTGRVIRVVATTSVVADMARLVGGTNVRTHTVVKAGLDPLSYRITAVDQEQAQRAEIVVGVGRGLEPWLASLGGPPARLLSDGLPDRPGADGAADPFVWHDAANGKEMLRTMAAVLGSVDPEDGSAFRFSAEAAAAKVDQADAGARRLLAPRAGRGIVTTKATMGWFAARYGLEVVGSIIPSASSTALVTPQHLTELKAAIQGRGVSAVFGEVSVAAGPPEALAAETGTVAVVGPDALCGDGLGTAGTDADTYVGCLTHNAREIAARA